MAFELTLGQGIGLASGILYMLLGAWVLTIRPRNRLTILLGGYAVAFGLMFAGINVLDGLDHPWAPGFQGPVAIVVGLLSVALVWHLPRPLAGRWHRAIVVPAIVTGITLMAMAAVIDTSYLPPDDLATFYVGSGLSFLAVSLLGVRAHPRFRQPAEDPAQQQLVAVALMGLNALAAGFSAVAFARGEPLADQTLLARSVPFYLVMAGLWFVNASADEGRAARGSMRVAVSVLGIMFAGMVLGSLSADARTAAGTHPARGIIRTVMVLLLVYAIVHRQVLGMDVRVRWTIQKSTLAGAFVAAFFIASELAAEFFGERTGSTVVGIVVAGLLLFAISPLQRLADRVATAAVPLNAHEAGPSDRSHVLYREAVERLYDDGELSAADERMLAHLAQELGIGAGDALDIRREIEAALEAEP